ncbi:ATP-binding protein [Solimonas sp. K1W22B-7]|nr:ATP-binding protein [Solimonas sp. K1W22B-7]
MAFAPTKIICVSTSPFDKFPVLRRDRVTDGYSYLGLRGLPSQNLGLAYMSRIMFALIEAADRSSEQAAAIAGVLNYLGYEGVVHARFMWPSEKFIEEISSTDDPHGYIDEYLRRPMMMPNDGNPPLRKLQAMGRPQLRKLFSIAKKLCSAVGRRRIDIAVSSEGVHVGGHPAIDRGDLIQVASSGILRLREVSLSKPGVERPILLHEASSGEQAVVMGLLGIGSQIMDGALVCIDEPEVCLHPEWQERYIDLLFHTFNGYRDCHFVIATHSPQMVANIPDGNCYVMAMESGTARSARTYSHRSVDFQLAELFNAPGHRNEYLNRIALNTFAKVTKAKNFDEQSLESLRTLRKVADELREDDPLRDLIAALEEMAQAYG